MRLTPKLCRWLLGFLFSVYHCTRASTSYLRSTMELQCTVTVGLISNTINSEACWHMHWTMISNPSKGIWAGVMVIMFWITTHAEASGKENQPWILSSTIYQQPGLEFRCWLGTAILSSGMKHYLGASRPTHFLTVKGTESKISKVCLTEDRNVCLIYWSHLYIMRSNKIYFIEIWTNLCE